MPAHFPPSTLYTTFTLTGLHGIDEVNFAFSASVVLMMNWEDHTSMILVRTIRGGPRAVTRTDATGIGGRKWSS